MTNGATDEAGTKPNRKVIHAAGPDDIDSCPGCGVTTGVQPTAAPPKVQAWTCARCGMQWAITVVNPHLCPVYLADVAAAAEKIGRPRGTLRQICALADYASTFDR